MFGRSDTATNQQSQPSHPLLSQLNREEGRENQAWELDKQSPISWQTWSPLVLIQARRQNKPVLLSICCQASHWCRRMHQEVFSDPEIAERLNEKFICIYVDRETRPDLDETYQLTHQLLTGRTGGWPLTAFLCPNTQLPYFIGTYFSLNSNGERIGFKELLAKSLYFFHQQQGRLQAFSEKVNESLKRLDEFTSHSAKVDELNEIVLTNAVDNLLRVADTCSGGFGTAPKFAMPFHLLRLLDAHQTNVDFSHRAGRHVHLTLTIMAKSGLRDLLSGGFFRYCSDIAWNVPHFEKMLYDNALLLEVYAEASVEFESPLFTETAMSIIHWILNDMNNGEGAFYGSMHADDGQQGEGGYYCWETDDLKKSLTHQEYSVMSVLCGWQGSPNFSGRWHLQMVRRKQDAVKLLGLSEMVVTHCYQSATAKLLRVRQSHGKPLCNDKIICSYNALTARSLTIAGRLLAQPHCVQAAGKNLDFLYQYCWDGSQLISYYRGTEVTDFCPAFLDDYVYLMDALWEQVQSDWREDYFTWITTLAQQVMDKFGNGTGGYYLSSDQHEPLVYQVKPWFDRITPSANGIAAKVFIRLGYMTGERRYWQVGERILVASWPLLERHPELHDSLLQALSEYKKPTPHILIRGQFSMEWNRALVRLYGIQVQVFASQVKEGGHGVFERVPEGTGQVCIGFQRQKITKSLSGVLALLRALGLKVKSKQKQTGLNRAF